MTESWRTRPIVLEMARRFLILEGRRTELPPKEFELLATLAARPGEAVSAKELIQSVWPESSVMTPHDLYWYVWSLRRMIGDGDRDKKLIANRRGVGYYLDLRPEDIEILERGFARVEDERPRGEPVIPPSRSTVGVVDGRAPANGAILAAASRRSPIAVVGLSVGAAALVALSSLAGYWVSQGQNGGVVSQAPITPPESAPPESPLMDGSKDDSRKRDRAKKKPKHQKRNKGTGESSDGGSTSPGAHLVAGGGSVLTGSDDDASTTSTTTSNPQPDGNGGSGGGGNGGGGGDGDGRSGGSSGGPKPTEEKAEEPSPPPPDATLYHLYDPESGDHISTTSTSTVAHKEAVGYRASTEGYVFTYQTSGTTSISTNSGTVYIYRDYDNAPPGTSVAVLHRVDAGGEIYYTSSAGEIGRADARGWSHSEVGYVYA